MNLGSIELAGCDSNEASAETLSDALIVRSNSEGSFIDRSACGVSAGGGVVGFEFHNERYRA